MMPEGDREKALERAERRQSKSNTKRGLDVPPEFYNASEFGYHYGWPAIMAYRRGYTIVPKTDEDLLDDKKSGKDPDWTSKYKREMLTTPESLLLMDGANKVWYKKLTEQVHAGVVSNSFSSGAKTFDAAVKPFTDKAEMTE